MVLYIKILSGLYEKLGFIGRRQCSAIDTINLAEVSVMKALRLIPYLTLTIFAIKVE